MLIRFKTSWISAEHGSFSKREETDSLPSEVSKDLLNKGIAEPVNKRGRRKAVDS